ncbi:hypothetical protein HY374_03345 [Candidatus Berkelbacteria bacterium]|nr:hypothetical protein [Candidatus Berkelbacteria bacterium]
MPRRNLSMLHRKNLIALAIVIAVSSFIPALAQESTRLNVLIPTRVDRITLSAGGFFQTLVSPVGREVRDLLAGQLANSRTANNWTVLDQANRVVASKWRDLHSQPSTIVIEVDAGLAYASMKTSSRQSVDPISFINRVVAIFNKGERQRITTGLHYDRSQRRKQTLYVHAFAARISDATTGEFLAERRVYILSTTDAVTSESSTLQFDSASWSESASGQDRLVGLVHETAVPLAAVAQLNALVEAWRQSPEGQAAGSSSPSSTPSSAPALVPAHVRKAALRAKVALQPQVYRILDAGGKIVHVSVSDPATKQVVDPAPHWEFIDSHTLRIFYHDPHRRRAEVLNFTVRAERS